MTLREISQRILDLYRTSSNSKDAENIDIRHIISFIETSRARILQQRFSKPMYYINENLIQSLIGEEFELIKSNNTTYMVDGISLGDLGRDILVSKRSIPKTIDRKTDAGTWVRVSPSDMLNVRINMTHHEKALISGYGKFNHDTLYGFEYNGKLGITCKNPTILEGITNLDLRGVFESPINLMKLQYPTLEDEELWELEYPISSDLIDDVSNMIINEKLRIPMESSSPELPKE